MRNPEFVKAAFSAIATRYVATNHVLSMGVDLLWRQRVVQLVSEWKPKRLLDLATGTGDLALAILRAMLRAAQHGQLSGRPEGNGTHAAPRRAPAHPGLFPA